jgi:HTH-like domain
MHKRFSLLRKKRKDKTENELTSPLYVEIGRLIKMDTKCYPLGDVGWNRALIIRFGDNAAWQASLDPVSIMNLPVKRTVNLLLMRLIDEQYMLHPKFGYPRMIDWPRNDGYMVNRKRVARLMQRMELQAITPEPQTKMQSSSNRKITKKAGRS